MSDMVINSFVSSALKLKGYEAKSQMLPTELQAVYNKVLEYYEGGNTLEIGAYKGMTSYVILNALEQSGKMLEGSSHYIIDVFKRDAEDWDWGYGDHPKRLLLKNIGYLRKYATIIKNRSLAYDVISTIVDKKFDFAFIDGDHRTATLLLELHMVDYVCEHILVHDYGFASVTRAVDMFLTKTGYGITSLVPNTGLYEIIKDEKDTN